MKDPWWQQDIMLSFHRGTKELCLECTYYDDDEPTSGLVIM